jgi:hypothetical protein
LRAVPRHILTRISKEEQFIRQLTLTKTVMLSGVFFCAAKDLNLNDVRDSDGEILRPSLSDSLRMTVSCGGVRMETEEIVGMGIVATREL